MYTVTQDIRGCLSTELKGIQAFGHLYSPSIELDDLAGTERHLFEMLSSLHGGTLSTRITAKFSEMSTIYLDPLYVLFNDLRASDVVMVLDLSPVTTPEWHSPAVSKAYDIAFEKILRERPRLVAISANTRDHLWANFGYPQERIDVVPLYLPRHFTVEAPKTHFVRPYALFVGSLEARKNIQGAIQAFRLSGLANEGFELLVVGGHGHGAEAVHDAARRTQGVRLLGYVSNEQLHALYAGASAFLYPSYLEGFGVPLLEALNAGVPCVASTAGACPEVGGELATYADPDDHQALANALVNATRLDPDARRAFAQRARDWVDENFSVDRFTTRLRLALGLEDPAAAPEVKSHGGQTAGSRTAALA